MNRPPGTEIRSVPGNGSPRATDWNKNAGDAALRSQSEVDQHIAAENNVEPFLEQHLAVVTEADAAKANVRFEQIAGLEFLVTNIFEVFPAQGAAGIAQGILAVNAGACGFERIIVQTGGENVPGPTGKSARSVRRSTHRWRPRRSAPAGGRRRRRQGWERALAQSLAAAGAPRTRT
jgi:hypothetical protein